MHAHLFVHRTLLRYERQSDRYRDQNVGLNVLLDQKNKVENHSDETRLF